MNKILLRISTLLVAFGGIAVGTVATAQVKVSMSDRIAIMQSALSQTASGTSQASKARRATVNIVNNTVGVMLIIDKKTSLDDLEANGLEVEGVIGDCVYGTAQVSNLDEIAGTKGVKQFSVSRKKHLRNDKSRTLCGVDKVQAGTDLLKSYTGDDVVLGVVDTGIDPNHITFLNSDGSNRVKRVWQYTQYGLKTECADSQVASYTTDDKYETHGTHVLGTAGGSCTTTDNGNDYHGVASDAILAVSPGDLSEVHILAAVQNITDYAKSLGKPVVINMSIGDNYGPHDGTDAFTTALNELAKETPIILAAGNEGDLKIALVHEFANNTTPLKTMVNKTSYTYDDYSEYGASRSTQGVGSIDVWGDDDTPLSVYVDIVKTSDPSTPLYSMEVSSREKLIYTGTAHEDFFNSLPSGADTNSTFSTYYSNGFIYSYGSVDKTNNRYHAELAFFLNPKSTAGTRVAVRVQGKTGHKVYLYSDSYDICMDNGSNYSGYTTGSSNGSISNMACGKNTISIGACVSRETSSSAKAGTLCGFSSWGELVDGRVLPDLIAPGSTVRSAVNSQMSKLYFSSYGISADDTTTKNNKTYYWAGMQGTSMAAPYATGVVALMLQAYPELNVEDIRYILTKSATTMTGDGTGAGRINAFEAVKMAENFSGVSSIKVDAKDITIAPNGLNQWRVYAPNESRVKATVRTINGTIVRNVQLDSDDMLSLSELTTGIYVVTLTGDRTTAHYKLAVN